MAYFERLPEAFAGHRRDLTSLPVEYRTACRHGVRTRAPESSQWPASVYWPNSKTGGGATGTIRPSTSPRMPTSGFEVRGRIVRRRSLPFASVHLEVDRRGQ